MTDFRPRDAFDGYKIDRFLGKGGMGAVYLATDTVLDRKVAVKFITSVDDDSTARKRFVIEARAIARLQHPNVVAIFRVGELDGYPYLVSEYVRGTPLDELDLPVSYEHALKLSIGIACGLTTAHYRGVLHRDIKPANAILSEDGTVKLLDFGIAKLVRQTVPGDDRQNSTSPEGPPGAPVPASPVSPGADPLTPTTASEILETDATVQHAMDHTLPLSADDALQQPADDTPPQSLDDTVALGEPSSPASSHAAPQDPGLTAAGRLLGTPRFMAPELWQGAPASFQSDIYAFGVLMYALLTGAPPHSGDRMVELFHNIVNHDAPPLREVAPHVDPEFAAVIDRCLHRDPARRYASMNDVRSQLERLASDVKYDVVPDGNPYRGLNVFEANHQNLFFGRDSEIRLILERLNKSPFVLVAGDSGVGKSSLCRAGVLPRIGKWLMPKRAWTTVHLVPGRFPVRALAAALSPIASRSESDAEAAIQTDPGGFARTLRTGLGTENGLVIFIDQLEEIATISDRNEAGFATELLFWLIMPSPSIRVLATARGDFLSRLAELPHIGDDISRGLFFARPLSKERTREAIVGPARMKGVTFESQELVEELVASTERAGGGLPLLQFALAELWDRRDKAKQTISMAALDRMGGVVGALNRHADSVLAGMPERERRAAKRVFLDLVSADRTRARRTAEELGAVDSPDVRHTLDALVRGRLVVASDSDEGAGYEVAHESLIRGWHTLSEWLSSDEEKRLARERLRVAVKEWMRLDRSPDLLWRGDQLDEIADLDSAALTERENQFIHASLRNARRRRIRRVLAIASVPFVALLVYGGLQLKAWSDLETRISATLAKADGVLTRIDTRQRETTALRQTALGRFDAVEPERGEAIWAQYLAKRDKLMPLFREAGGHLETALLLDPKRTGVRHRFTSFLFDRARFAEQSGDTDEAAELVARLSLYDTGGEWMRKWRAPGQVTIHTEPQNAEIRLFEFVPQPDGRIRREPLPSIPSPIEQAALPQGSYLAQVAAAGFAPAIRPFTVRRGKPTHLHIPLLAPARVPEGFVYVAPGRFRFGSAADEGLRRDFFHTVPLHDVLTGPFLIAKHETTFSEWLEYVASLPADAQSAALPRVEKGGFQGALTVERNAEGEWSIAFQPTTVRYTAREGEPIRYPKRRSRTSQDWRRFPVFGITAADAAQYTQWLDATGRVPGARLCTDMEWEQAARGSDGRAYPHGERLYRDDANFDATYGKRPETMGPDEVCAHPISTSPFGLCDMAGNVWEWVRSSLAEDEYAARGGSYLFGQNSARVTDREVTEPSFRDVSVGVRICADVPIP